jgi:hypothetical protein
MEVIVNSETQLKKDSRLGSGILILAAIVMVVGAAIPFFAPSLRDAPWTDDPSRAAAAIAGNPGAYAWAHGLFIAAAILTALGLVPVSLGFRGSSRPWAMMALSAFAFAAVLSTINRTINIEVFTWGAVQGVDATNFSIQSIMRFQEGLSYAFYILAFLALGLYGIAILLQSKPSGLGWVFVVAGILGLVLRAFGDLIPAFVFLGTAALGVATWLQSFASEAKPEPGNSSPRLWQ